VHGHATAQGDEAKLRQVVTNLLRNAVDACGETGRVVVLIDDPKPGVATLVVSDTGGGIGAPIRERIFEPFFTTKATGSGLGLAISRAIARAHGGDLSIASTSDRGSTFRVTLPERGPEAT
jgi:signal transduction histidine kinase